MKKILLLSVCVIFFFVSCTKKVVQVGDSLITLTDSQNRTISLPQPAQRIVVLADSALCVISQLNADDSIVALDSKTLSGASMLLAFKKNPGLLALPNVGKANNANYEAIVNLVPDVIFIKSSADDALAIEQNTGIPVVCVKYEKGIEFSMYHIIAQVLGKEKECDELLTFYQSKLNELSDFTSKIPDEEKISAYISVANSKGVATRTLIDLQGLALAGGKNVASSVAKSNEWGECDVTKESILTWNPQIVFIDRSNRENAVTVSSFKADADFALLSAVQKGNVFQTFYFYAAPKDYAVLISEGFHNARILYPEKMPKTIADKSINAILGFAYGIQDYENELY